MSEGDAFVYCPGRFYSIRAGVVFGFVVLFLTVLSANNLIPKAEHIVAHQ